VVNARGGRRTTPRPAGSRLRVSDAATNMKRDGAAAGACTHEAVVGSFHPGAGQAFHLLGGQGSHLLAGSRFQARVFVTVS
jgi:hypothetical protein